MVRPWKDIFLFQVEFANYTLNKTEKVQSKTARQVCDRENLLAIKQDWKSSVQDREASLL